jgi:hypothetical protein
MTSQSTRCLGILDLERGPPGATFSKLPGSLRNPTTFDVPLIIETVEGAWADVVIPGHPALEEACVAAARRLVERGAVVIASDCGFFIRHQAAVAAAVKVPVVMSTLLLVPTVLRQLPPAAKLAVLSADSRHLHRKLLGVDDPTDQARIVIGGIEGGKYLAQAMQRPLPPTDVAAVEEDVTSCVARIRAAHPEVAAMVCECTAFPLVTPVIRRITKLPVYDITNLCKLTLASVN